MSVNKEFNNSTTDINSTDIPKKETSITNSSSNLFTSLKNRFNKPLTQLQMLIIFFFIYSVIGWLLETIYCVYELGHFEKRGFLYGPLCPIYGYGAIILLVLLQPFNKNKFCLFIYSAIVFSVFEYLVGYGLDALFSMKFWDYTNEFLNINGRITLWFSIIWGIFGILFMNYIHKFIEKFTNMCANKISYIIQHIILYFMVIIFIVDTIFSIIKYLS